MDKALVTTDLFFTRYLGSF